MRKSSLFLLAAPVAFAFLAAPVPGQAQSSPVIEITMGSWGYAGDRKNVKDDLAKLCNGKQSCKFMVQNEMSPSEPKDPSPGNAKGLMLGWKCGETAHKDQFPQNKYAELKC